MRNLKNQVGQLATALSNSPQGSLPSNTEDLRREDKEHCKVINLRSGKDVDISVGMLRKTRELILTREELLAEKELQ